MVGMQQVTTPTTLTVEIISSPWVAVDSNGAATELPSVYVVAARVTNTGTVAAENVVVTLDYQEVTNWTLLSGEDPVRTIASLGSGETYYAYWFARYPQATSANHQYTVNAEADNATLVSTSENVYDPSGTQTVETRSTINTGNQSLLQTDAAVTVGYTFSMTQTFDLGTKPEQIAFNPVGNPTFDPSAYRLLSVEGRILNVSGGTISTFIDEVYLDNVDTNAASAEIVYSFVALLPKDTTICSYAAIAYPSGGSTNEKYDKSYCTVDTAIDIDGDIALDLDKRVDLLQVEQDEILQYTIAYTNTGDKPLSFSWIWDELPDNTTLLTETISPASDENNTTTNQVAWTLGTIPPTGEPDSSGSLSFQAKVEGGGIDIPDGESLVNSAYLGINPGTSIPARKALTDTVTSVVQAPVVTTSKTVSDEMPQPGDNLTYVIQITNTGSISASDITVVDELPDGIILNGTPTPNFSSQVGQTLTWNNLEVGVSSTLDITVPVKVDPNLSETGAMITNVGDITFKNSVGYTFEPQTVSAVIMLVVPETQLELSKTGEDLNGEPLVVSDTVRYTLQVTNTGTFTAYNVTVTDDLPDEVTCVSVSDGLDCADDPLVWNVGNLAPNGGTESLTIDVTINEGTENMSIINSASVTATNVGTPPDNPKTCPDGSLPDSNSCDTVPVGNTELEISKTGKDQNGGSLVVGDTVLYTVQVTNTGTITAFNVTVTDDLPEEVTCVSVSDGLSCADDPLIWNVGDLDPNGGTKSLTIEVTINEGTEGMTIVNSASVTSSNVIDPPGTPKVCPDGSLLNDDDECDTIPQGIPNLTLAKLAEDLNGAPVVVGDTIRYTLQVANTGTYTAFNVTVTDDLPDEVTCQSVSNNLVCDDPLIWEVGDLAGNGGTASLTIDVTINEGTEGMSIINSASVTATNVVDIPENPEVCPDGSPPNNGVCDEVSEIPPASAVFLPILIK
ncbi:MAG: DUF11 domain-containing protein [Anaerolineae bacterium]|nr:DUF11 domain-containing protein [Anaerolineae bacterium]